MENITSIVLNENILVMRSPTNVIRLIRGKVIYLKELKQSLPSTFAASYNSRGMLSIPASVKMHMNGILTQASAIIHPNMANVALEKTGRGLSINPSFIRKSLNTPTSGLNIHFQIKPEITNGTAQGNIASDLNTAEEVFDNKYGDCKDKATLLLAMYKAAGIPAWYALIGTRDMGKLEEDIPMSQFNHAIVLAEVDGKMVWLDPTAEVASFGEVPGDDQEKLALVFFPDEARFLKVPLKAPEENALRTNMLININPDASIDVRMEMQTSGATDMDMRSFKYIKPARRKQIVENWINSIAPGAKLKEYSFSDLEDLNIPVRLNVAFSAPDYLKRAGDVWLFTIPGIQMEAGLVGKEKRNYPITFSTTSLSIDRAEIHLPAQFEAQFIPEGTHLQLPYISFKSSYEAVGGTIFYEGILRRNNTKIEISQYPQYKDFMERVSRKSQEQIVIKLKKQG